MQQSQGLFPADPVEFERLIEKVLSEPRLSPPTLTPEEEAIGGRLMNEAIQEKHRRLELEALKLEVARTISSIAYQELIDLTNSDYENESTRAAYRADFSAFQSWCATQNYPSLPSCPEILALHLIILADGGACFAHLQRVVSSVKYFHRWNETPIDTDDVQVRATLRWIRQKQREEAGDDTSITTAPEPQQGINGSGQPH